MVNIIGSRIVEVYSAQCDYLQTALSETPKNRSPHLSLAHRSVFGHIERGEKKVNVRQL